MAQFNLMDMYLSASCSEIFKTHAFSDVSMMEIEGILGMEI